jgi:hypothetical protein
MYRKLPAYSSITGLQQYFTNKKTVQAAEFLIRIEGDCLRNLVGAISYPV